MDRVFVIILTIQAVAISCSQTESESLVLVKGGSFKNPGSSYYSKNITIADFYIGKYEVTQKEWTDIMGNNPSTFKGDNLPVETISWYDCISYCNKRSVREGLQPYYTISDTLVSVHEASNGYRLPTEAEWEYAASGGQQTKAYRYSGGNNVDEVAWYWKNSGDKYLDGAWTWPALQANHNKTKPVGTRRPNEAGIYDMSGNVREWCWDRDGNEAHVWRGGGWMGADFCCELSFRASHDANGKGPDQGFRVCRSAKPAK